MEKKMVTRSSDVLIVGGGPAGTAAGIALATKGYSVSIIEKEEIVKDKICGEFFSPECLSYFDDLKIKTDFFDHSPSPIKKVCISLSGSPIQTTLDNPAYGLSRISFDSNILKTAAQRGVTVYRDVKIMDMQFYNGHVIASAQKRKTGEQQKYTAKFILGATGAKSGSESLFVETEKFNSRKTPYIGFKFHAECPSIRNTIELYFTPFGYVGIGTIENGKVNVCGLIDISKIKIRDRNMGRLLNELLKRNSSLGERFDLLNNNSSHITCSNLTFGIRKQKYNEVFCIGDTAGSIHPFCGDGMAMALKSGLLVAEIIERGIINNWNRERTVQHFRRVWKKEFSTRILFSTVVHWILSNNKTISGAAYLTNIFPGLVHKVFKLTRDTIP